MAEVRPLFVGRVEDALGWLTSQVAAEAQTVLAFVRTGPDDHDWDFGYFGPRAPHDLALLAAVLADQAVHGEDRDG